MYHYLVAVKSLRHPRNRLTLATLAVAEHFSYASPLSTTFTTMNVLAGYSASRWLTKTQASWRLFYIFMFANAAASAMPLDGFDHQRRQSNGGQSNSGGLSSSVWVRHLYIPLKVMIGTHCQICTCTWSWSPLCLS